jgi:hypothetical protein
MEKGTKNANEENKGPSNWREETTTLAYKY